MSSTVQHYSPGRATVTVMDLHHGEIKFDLYVTDEETAVNICVSGGDTVNVDTSDFKVFLETLKEMTNERGY